MTTEQDTPKPGTTEARSAGCICPILANHAGATDLPNRHWFIVNGCPVHFPEDNP